jgi:hypothetical protein
MVPARLTQPNCLLCERYGLIVLGLEVQEVGLPCQEPARKTLAAPHVLRRLARAHPSADALGRQAECLLTFS